MLEKNNRPEIVYIKTSNLKLNPNNPRKNDVYVIREYKKMSYKELLKNGNYK